MRRRKNKSSSWRTSAWTARTCTRMTPMRKDKGIIFNLAACTRSRSGV